jgi:hypothetical protein
LPCILLLHAYPKQQKYHERPKHAAGHYAKSGYSSVTASTTAIENKSEANCGSTIIENKI